MTDILLNLQQYANDNFSGFLKTRPAQDILRAYRDDQLRGDRFYEYVESILMYEGFKKAEIRSITNWVESKNEDILAQA